MTKHTLEVTLGLVRKANLQGRLYISPPDAALDYLTQHGAILAQPATPTSPAGYVALARVTECPAVTPMRRAHAD